MHAAIVHSVRFSWPGTGYSDLSVYILVMSEAEIWKPIPGHDGYEVSSLGRVRSFKTRDADGGRTGPWRIGTTPHVLAPNIIQGYCSVKLTGGQPMRVHRLVLLAFAGPCPDGMEGCHFPDHNRQNNRLDNLRWDTRLENNRDTCRLGRHRVPRGSGHACAKLTEESVRGILAYLALGFHYAETAAVFGVSTPNVAAIALRKTWRHVESDPQATSKNRRLSEGTKSAIRGMLTEGASYSQVIARHRVGIGTVHAIKHGISRRKAQPGASEM